MNHPESIVISSIYINLLISILPIGQILPLVRGLFLEVRWDLLQLYSSDIFLFQSSDKTHQQLRVSLQFLKGFLINLSRVWIVHKQRLGSHEFPFPQTIERKVAEFKGLMNGNMWGNGKSNRISWDISLLAKKYCAFLVCSKDCMPWRTNKIKGDPKVKSAKPLLAQLLWPLFRDYVDRILHRVKRNSVGSFWLLMIPMRLNHNMRGLSLT